MSKNKKDEGYLDVWELDDDLEYCPFCETPAKENGELSVYYYKADWSHGKTRYHVHCNYCWANGPNRTSLKDAIDSWNGRKIHRLVDWLRGLDDRPDNTNWPRSNE